MRRFAPLLLVLAGCSGDPEVTPVPVRLHTGSVLLVAVDRLGDGVWQRLPPQADVTVEVGARWVVASVCGGAAFTDVVVAAYRSDDDGADVELPCRAPDGNRLPIAVTVTNGGPATHLQLGPGGGIVEGATAMINAYPGTWDLYAEDLESSRILIRRDVVVSDGSTIDVDFEIDGFAVEDRTISATGALGLLVAYTQVALAGDTWVDLPRPRRDGVVAAIPDERLGEGDRQYVHLDASDGSGNGNYAALRFDVEPIEVALPPPIRDGVLHLDAAGFGASWRVDDHRDGAWIWAQPIATTDRRTWSFGDPAAAAVGAIELPDLSSIPGWSPAWNLPLDVELWTSLSVSHDVDDGHLGARRYQTFPAAER